MSVKPIMFSVPMVRAKREGEKTHTRRILKPQPKLFICEDTGQECEVALEQNNRDPRPRIRLGRVITEQTVQYAVGDILWVREAWRVDASFDHLSPKQIETRCIYAGYKTGWAPIAYDAGGYSPSWGTNGWHELGRRRASMHMPRWASRLTLEVTGVKVERLQDISEADAKAEGVEFAPRPFGDWSLIPGIWDLACLEAGGQQQEPPAAIKYAYLWNSLNKDDGQRWADNPWVVAVIFKVHRMNVDAFLQQREAA